MGETMPQAVDVVGQAEQQGLADLGGQAAPGCARGELAFDGGEDAFDLVALPIRFFRKSSEHLQTIILSSFTGRTPVCRQYAQSLVFSRATTFPASESA